WWSAPPTPPRPRSPRCVRTRWARQRPSSVGAPTTRAASCSCAPSSVGDAWWTGCRPNNCRASAERRPATPIYNSLPRDTPAAPRFTYRSNRDSSNAERAAGATCLGPVPAPHAQDAAMTFSSRLWSLMFAGSLALGGCAVVPVDEYGYYDDDYGYYERD